MSKTKDIDQRRFLKDVSLLWPLAKGSLAEVRKPCIRPNCRACKQGEKHRAFIFSFTRNGKRFCRYVPHEMVEVLRQAILNGRKLEKKLFLLGEDIILRHQKQRDGGKR